MIFMLITLTILELLQHHLPGRVPEMVKYELHTHDIVAALKVIDAVAQSQRAHILETLAEKTDAGHILRFQATFPGIHSRKRSEQFFASLVAAPECESLNRDATAV